MSRIDRKLYRFKVSRQIIVGAIACLAIALFPTRVRGQIERATVREILGDRVFIDETPAEVDDIATFQQEVSTEESLVDLEFNNGAAGRLAPDSALIVGQCVEVQQGLLLASGPANGCTITFEVGVEGTFYLLEVSDRGDARVKVINGIVNLLSLAPDSDGIPVPLEAGQQMAIDPAGILGEVLPLPREDVEEILQNPLFQDFESELPGMKKLQVSLEQLYPGIVLPSLPGFKVLEPPQPLPPTPPPPPPSSASPPPSAAPAPPPPPPPPVRGLW